MKASELYKFDSHEFSGFVNYKSKLPKRIKKGLRYVCEILLKNGNFINVTPTELDSFNFSDIDNWYETKNYQYVVLKIDYSHILLRRYHTHFSFFCLSIKRIDLKDYKFEGEPSDNLLSFLSHLSLFTCHTSRDMIKGDEEHDLFIDNPEIDLDAHKEDIFKNILERKEQSLQFISKEKRFKIKLAYVGESVYSYDSLIFFAEELDTLYLELVAENFVYNELKANPDKFIGKKIDRGVVTSVKTDLIDGYYHSVGVNTTNENYIFDVYRIARWYFDDLFGEEEDKKD